MAAQVQALKTTEQWFALELVGSDHLFLDVSDAGMIAGTSACMAKRSNEPGQVWLYDQATGKVQSRLNGLFLHLSELAEPGGELTLELRSEGGGQHFTIEFYDEDGEDLEVMHVVAENGLMVGAAAMPGAFVSTVPPQDEDEDDEDEAAEKAEVEALKAAAVFASLDTDGNGTLDRGELVAGLKVLGHKSPTPEAVASMLSSVGLGDAEEVSRLDFQLMWKHRDDDGSWTFRTGDQVRCPAPPHIPSPAARTCKELTVPPPSRTEGLTHGVRGVGLATVVSRLPADCVAAHPPLPHSTKPRPAPLASCASGAALARGAPCGTRPARPAVARHAAGPRLGPRALKRGGWGLGSWASRSDMRCLRRGVASILGAKPRTLRRHSGCDGEGQGGPRRATES